MSSVPGLRYYTHMIAEYQRSDKDGRFSSKYLKNGDPAQWVDEYPLAPIEGEPETEGSDSTDGPESSGGNEKFGLRGIFTQSGGRKTANLGTLFGTAKDGVGTLIKVCMRSIAIIVYIFISNNCLLLIVALNTHYMSLVHFLQNTLLARTKILEGAKGTDHVTHAPTSGSHQK